MEFNWIPLLSVFGAALASSLHCTAMCGGIALAATESQWGLQSVYHGSRLLGYLLLGSVAGLLGKTIFFEPNLEVFGLVLAWALSIFLLYSGITMFFNIKTKIKSAFLFRLAEQFIQKGLKQKPIIKASMIGLVTAFLPCGLLYSFVLLAVASHSLAGGALTLFFFWLGTIPSLAGGQLLIQKFTHLFKINAQKVVALLMVIAGLGSITLKLQATHAHQQVKNDALIQCH